MNQVTLLGRITKDVILRNSSNNKKFTYFTVAVDGYQQRVNYINCVAWDRLAENIAKYVGKGSQVLVSGYLITRRDNVANQTIMEVVSNNVTFLDRKKQYSNDYQTPEIIETHDDNATKDELLAQDELLPKTLTNPEVMHSESDYESDISFVSGNNLDHIINSTNNNGIRDNNSLDEDDEAIIWD